jgi:SAM-dependent methyltransferase
VLLTQFNLTPHNSQYVGTQSADEMRWRRICAVDKVNNMQSLLGKRNVENVLEVGCGTGAVLAEVARRGIGLKQVGIDVADPSDHADPGAATLDMMTYDGARLPFDDASFDLVYASHVVEHVENPRGLLTEISRVAKEVVYIEVPCELHFRTSHAALQSTLDIGHINSYCPETFLLTLQTAPLEVLDLKLFDHSLAVHCFFTSAPIGYIKKAIRQTALSVNPHLASRIFTYHCGALCQPARHPNIPRALNAPDTMAPRWSPS